MRLAAHRVWNRPLQLSRSGFLCAASSPRARVLPVERMGHLRRSATAGQAPWPLPTRDRMWVGSLAGTAQSGVGSANPGTGTCKSWGLLLRPGGISAGVLLVSPKLAGRCAHDTYGSQTTIRTPNGECVEVF